mmetsp:Transcript_1448/g.2533  ORF Transcript_1448/g.2533 Transcript_1448/m.2533 type:complete len:111 (+) Transcript_1448:143-475(+)
MNGGILIKSSQKLKIKRMPSGGNFKSLLNRSNRNQSSERAMTGVMSQGLEDSQKQQVKVLDNGRIKTKQISLSKQKAEISSTNIDSLIKRGAIPIKNGKLIIKKSAITRK